MFFILLVVCLMENLAKVIVNYIAAYNGHGFLDILSAFHGIQRENKAFKASCHLYPETFSTEKPRSQLVMAKVSREQL